MIIDHTHPLYQNPWRNSRENRWNGAFYYSQEIVKNIIPRVKTDRNWITINVPGQCLDHSIYFIHNNIFTENYDFIADYKDVVLVCGVPETVEKVSKFTEAGHAIYLPLSIDVEEVKEHACSKMKECAFVGRKSKIGDFKLPPNCDILADMRREQLLQRLGEYRKVYAVGRCALEAKALGCEILPYDPRYPDPSIWKVVDNKEAAKILQEKLNEIDKEEE